MTVSNHPHSSGLTAFILLVGAVIWSMMRVFSSIVLSIVSYLLNIYDACQTLAIKKSALEVEVMYNLANYPDEISIVAK